MDMVELNKRLRLYNASVLHRFLYSGSALAPSASQEAHMDITHRNHLRAILGIRNPEDIRNVTLYTQTRATPISLKLAAMRWGKLFNVLRTAPENPAHLLVRNYFTIDNEDGTRRQPYRGREHTNLACLFKKEFKAAFPERPRSFGPFDSSCPG